MVDYRANSVSQEIVQIEDIQVLNIEGTYILDINEFDFTIFINRNYKDTYENRMIRNRDEQTDFVEKSAGNRTQYYSEIQRKSGCNS